MMAVTVMVALLVVQPVAQRLVMLASLTGATSVLSAAM